MNNDNKIKPQNLFVPGFTPPSVSNDWERSDTISPYGQNPFYSKERAKFLKAQHFLLKPGKQE